MKNGFVQQIDSEKHFDRDCRVLNLFGGKMFPYNFSISTLIIG